MKPATPLMALACLACACDAPTQPEPSPPQRAELRAHSSTIVVAPDGLLWLTSPDDDAVIALKPDDLTVRETVALPRGSRPAEMAWLGSGAIVTLAQSRDVAWIEPGRAPELVALPCGGSRAVVAFDDERAGPTAILSCPHDAKLVIVDLAQRAVRRVIATSPRPEALALSGPTLVVASSLSGELASFELETLLASRAQDIWRTETLAPGHIEQLGQRPRAATRLRGLVAGHATGDVLGLFQLVDHDSDRDRPPSQGGYGSLVDSRPRIEPRIAGACATSYARFDGRDRVFSGPIASAFDRERELLWVVHRFSHNVALLRCREGRQAEHLATFPVGDGARGIALSPDGRAAYVDVGFDHAVAKLELPTAGQGGMLRDTMTKRREVGAMAWSSDALLGRRLFHDASDTHLTPSGVVACASCHPEGGDDGKVWFIHTRGISRRLRRTAPAWNARVEVGAFHWDGEFRDGATLARHTIVELMEGSALLVDTYAIAAYMNEVPTPPPAALSPERERLAARGRELFDDPHVGCSGCHRGSAYSDGLARSVLPASDDADAAIEAVVTRPLRGVRARAPYLHDGRAQTLRAIHERDINPDDQHGRTSSLSDEDREALVAFLETL